MDAKAKRIDQLLGALSPEEKAGQLLAYGFTGTFIEPALEEIIAKRNIGGIRTSPYFRKFIRYLPDGAPGIKNVVRPLHAGEKMWDEGSTPPQTLRASEYAERLNRLRRVALDRPHGIPVHTVMDYEGSGGNFVPPGMITTGSPMGQAATGDPDLVRRLWKGIAQQLKAIGIDWINAPVVDVNTNRANPEISTRAFGEDPETVIKFARAALAGIREGGVIGTLKHYPGRGDAIDDGHFGIVSIDCDRDTMEQIHLEPYRVLCGENIVPAIMTAHSLYPSLDPSGKLATISGRIVKEILRDEYKWDGVITTDSLTMGALMAQHSAAEAAVLAIEAGSDIVLLKDENALRFEVHDAVTEAIRSGRLSEERIAESLRRIWSLKWDYGLFEDGGIVEPETLDEFLMGHEFRAVAREGAAKCIQLMRDRDHILPLKPDQRVLVVDRAHSIAMWQNDSWTYPGMFWEFMLQHSRNVDYVDYKPKTIDHACSVVEEMLDRIDVLVVTARFTRGQKADTKPFVTELAGLGKPMVLVTNNPYELIVPEEAGTVVCSYSLLHDVAEATAAYLYGTQQT